MHSGQVEIKYLAQETRWLELTTLMVYSDHKSCANYNLMFVFAYFYRPTVKSVKLILLSARTNVHKMEFIKIK